MPATLAATKLSQRPFILLAGAVTATLVGGALALWAYYGTSVFYEMLLAGWAACF
ncbi:MAG TPA: hypothetical protein VFB45_24195 [Pseudolabrys sp.]|nr:hypothetical protein [Pseudolabrys sp.]